MMRTPDVQPARALPLPYGRVARIIRRRDADALGYLRVMFAVDDLNAKRSRENCRPRGALCVGGRGRLRRTACIGSALHPRGPKFSHRTRAGARPGLAPEYPPHTETSMTS